MYYIYILYSPSSNRYYVGFTNDVHRRLEEHNTSDRNTYTSKHRPWDLAAYFQCGEDMGHAMIIERYIKKSKSKLLIEKMVKGEPLHGLLAQLVRVPIVRD